MKDEIKEILEALKPHKDIKEYPLSLTLREQKILLEHITNLQEENKKLKEIVENLMTMTVCGDRKQIKNTAQYKLEIAQDRIDKAIEYIEEHIKYECDDTFNGMSFYSHHLYDFKKDDLLNILKGE